MTRTSFLLYLRTVQHLRPRQVAAQILRRAYRPPVPRFVGVPALRNVSGPVAWSNHRDRCRDPFSFQFLNLRRRFDPNCFDWKCSEMPRLWRYNLHYFDYLHEPERSRASIAFLLSDWIRENPPGATDGWEPFPLSLRIVNWIKLLLQPEWHNCAESSWLTSLYRQAFWLERNLEYHLLGNHLFKNGKALIFAGLFFEGRAAESWLRRGLEILRSQLEEQILPDGGHFERSVMYHAMILGDCLDLFNLCRREETQELVDLCGTLQARAEQMVNFLFGMTHPDGEIALFNDAAFGVEASPGKLAEYFENLTGRKLSSNNHPLQAFPHTGYFVMNPEPGNRMLIDAGPIGPDYQPGHAHCDTLSFELSCGGRRLIVDSGCFHYLNDEIRQYNRSNRGHNVVTVDGLDQSEIWGAHRVARRAEPLNVEFTSQGERLVFSGGHNGYRRLAGRPFHFRHIEWDGEKYLIEDRLTGSGEHHLESRFHVHPDFTVDLPSYGRIIIQNEGKPFAEILCRSGQEPTLEDGWYCPEFGKKLTCPVIVLKQTLSLPVQFRWLIRRL